MNWPRETGGNADDPAQPPAVPEETWLLWLYVIGRSPNSIRATANLQHVCEQWLPGRHHIEVVDLLGNPRLAADDQILAVPTVVRKFPEPIRKVVGDLSDTERLLFGLQLPPERPRMPGWSG